KPSPVSGNPSNKAVYWLEFASYNDEKDANKFAKELTKSGAPSKVVNAPDQLHYVISDRYFATESEARSASEVVANKVGYATRVKHSSHSRN
ncbi:MAG: SPOR domain-containing protein, partial [Verrucomicrobiota bacterium]